MYISFWSFAYNSEYFLSYSLSLFLGWNNNPNEIQFKAAYRKLLVCMPFSSARSGNCIVNSTEILTISSSRQAQQPEPSEDHIEEIEINDEEFYSLMDINLEPYDEHTQAYLASTIEERICKNIMNRSKSACQDCLAVFNENERIHDNFIAKKHRKEPHSQPCLSTVKIISACNAVFKLLQSKNYVNVDSMAKTIFGKLRFMDLYEESSFEIHQYPNGQVYENSHGGKFIFDVMLEFLRMKSIKVGKRITIEEQKGRVIRKKLSRNIIFAGQ